MNIYLHILNVIASIIVMLFVTGIVAPVLLLFYVISTLHYRILKLKYGSRICYPSGQDIFYGIEKAKSNSYCNLIFGAEGNLGFEQFKNHVWNRFQMDVFPIKSRRLRRYQQRYVCIGGYNYYIDDLNPDKDYHFVEVTKQDLYNDPRLRTNSNSIESFISDEDAKDEFQLIADHMMKKYGNTKLDTNKPPWQLFFYKYGNRCMVLFRFSHVVVDGVHFLRFLLKEFGDKSIVQSLPYTYKRPQKMIRILYLLWSYLLIPIGLGNIFRPHRPNPLLGPKLNGNKTRISSEVIPLQDIKDIKKSCQTSFNAILFSCAAYALRCHYRTKGKKTPESYIVVPVSLQDIEKEIKTKNSHGLMSIKVTTETEDVENDCALNRLRKIEDDLFDSKNNGSFAPIQLAIRMLCPLFPLVFNTHLLRGKAFTLALSNMTGPSTELLKIGEASLKHLIFWIPDRDPLGMCLTFVGNMQDFRIGLQMDWALMKTNSEIYGFLENMRKELYTLRRELGLDPVAEKSQIF